MIQVVVQKDDNGKYELAPVLEKPEKGQNPASYLINSKEYLQLLNQKHVRPVPLKYRQHSTAILGQLSMSESFVEKVDEMYRNGIEKADELSRDGIKEQDGPVDNSQGITLRPNTNEIIEWDKDTPIVQSDAVTNDTTVPYSLEASIISIKRAMYNTPIYIKAPAPRTT